MFVVFQNFAFYSIADMWTLFSTLVSVTSSDKEPVLLTTQSQNKEFQRINIWAFSWRKKPLLKVKYK